MSRSGYDRYAASGVRWLGDVPAHWTVAKLGHRAEVQLGKMLDSSRITGSDLRPYLRNVHVQWDRVDVADLPEMDFDAEDRRKFALRPGDLLVCEGGEIGRAAVWRGELAECYYQKALHRVRPTRGDDFRFVYWSIAAAAHTGAFSEGANATTIEHLPAEKLRAHRFCFPPVPEQEAIAAFLDRETVEIDALIEKQGEFVVRLEEHRRALVSEAVTRGLWPTSSMRDTGLKVIPTVPVHWAVKRLRHIAGDVTVGVVVTPSKYYADTGVPALRSLNVRNMRIVHDDLVFFDEISNRLLAKSMLNTDDLVAVRTGKPGTTAVVGPDLDGANCIDLIIIRKSPRFVSRFLAYVMNSDLAHAQYAVGSEGAIQQHFNIEAAKDLLVPLPPVEEQAAIVQRLDARLARLDAIHARSTEMIERLREHRAVLITAAITGKIDVRFAATAVEKAA